MTGHEFTKARTKGSKDKKTRRRKGQGVQDLKSWADSEPGYRIKPRKRLSLRGDAPGLHYQYPSRESFGLKKAVEIEKARTIGAKDKSKRRSRGHYPIAGSSEAEHYYKLRGQGRSHEEAASSMGRTSKGWRKIEKAVEVDGKKHSKKRTTGDHDITERRKIAEPKTKTQEFVGETNKALYVVVTNDVVKAQVKGFIRTKKGKMERVNPFTRNVPVGSAVKVANFIAGHFNVKHFSRGESNPYSSYQHRSMSIVAKNEEIREKRLANLKQLLTSSGYAKAEDSDEYKKGSSTIEVHHEPAEKYVGGKAGEHIIRISVSGPKKSKPTTIPYYD